MAMRSDRPRLTGRRLTESGLSIIEALVIVTVTAVIAALLLPIVSRATGRNAALADRALDAAAMANGERAFSAVLGAVDQPAVGSDAAGLDGQSTVMTLLTDPAEPVACVPAGGGGSVRLRIVTTRDAGRLMCSAGSAQQELARWRDGEAAFSYSTDGVAWLPVLRSGALDAQTTRGGAAPRSHVAEFVRFALNTGDGQQVIWIARAGATEATNLNPQSAGPEAQAP